MEGRFWIRVAALPLAAWLGCALLYPENLFSQPGRDVAVDIVRLNKPRRIALVIGNAGYATGRLRNPLNDADDMWKALENLGFKVTLKKDVDQEAMEEAIIEFGEQLDQGSEGIFYFAGHGIQVDGRNYLIPVGKEINSGNIKFKAVDLGFLLERMGGGTDRLNVVILDACRNNPFDSSVRQMVRGLARAEAPAGVFIAYAAAPGQVAEDGQGRNGTFTKHLLEALKIPDLPIEIVFKRTRAAVVRETDGRQTPWTSSSLVGNFVPNPRIHDLPLSASATPPMLSPFGGDETPIERIRRMRQSFHEIEAYEKNTEALPAAKATAWARFLDVFREDNTSTDEDSVMRDQARNRMAYWRRQETDRDKERALPDERVIPRGIRAGDSFINALGMRFLYAPADNFQMGSRREEVERESDEVLHKVEITRGFFFGETEVTQSTWERVMNSNPSYFHGCGEDCPVERVNWYESLLFAVKLSEVSHLEPCYRLERCRGTPGFGCENEGCAGDYVCDEVEFVGPSCEGYRLPTEAEWEYAARAGTDTRYALGDELSARGMNCGVDETALSSDFRRTTRTVPDTTVPVRSSSANPWGIHEVHGNVSEWVWNQYGPYSVEGQLDPTGPEGEGSYRVTRGGSWRRGPASCRSAARGTRLPSRRQNDLGFRLVITSD